MIRNVGLALVMVLVASASVEGQRRDRGPEGPINALVELREELGLSEAQIAQLHTLESTLEAQNEPLVARLMEIRRAIRGLGRREDFTPEQRAQYDAHLEEARPLMKQIRDHSMATMRQIGSILTQAQREQLSEILRERDTDGRRGDTQRSRRNG